MTDTTTVHCGGLALNVSSAANPLVLEMLGWELRREEQEKATNLSGFSSIDPEITAACDHACTHCWAELGGKHMSLDTFTQVLDYCESVGINTIQFTGGEPTLNPQFEAMARLAKERGFTSILRTHGRHLPKERQSAEGGTISNADICARYFDKVIVSIDGMAMDNFTMRPTRAGQRAVDKALDAGDPAAVDLRQQQAQLQFDQTMQGYQALCDSVRKQESLTGTRPQLHFNSVVAQSNFRGMGPLGAYLEEAARSERFIIDRWDLTQVMPAAINTPEQHNQYTIGTDEFVQALIDASTASPSLTKRAKPVTEGRSVIVDNAGKVYVGGRVRVDIGNIHTTAADTLTRNMARYVEDTGMLDDKDRSYMHYAGGNRTQHYVALVRNPSPSEDRQR